jgi:hypothetical protein
MAEITVNEFGLIIVIATALVSAVWTLKSSIDRGFTQVRKDIADIRADYVRHDVCDGRRDKCPCVKDIETLKIKIEGVRK